MKSFYFFYKNFAVDGSLLEDGEKVRKIKDNFTKKYGTTSNPGKDVSLAVEVRLNPTELAVSMEDLHRVYEKANIDIQARYGILRKNINMIPYLAQFALYHVDKSKEELKHVVKYSDLGTKDFKLNRGQRAGSFNTGKSIQMHIPEKPTNPCRPVSGTGRIEDKVDKLAYDQYQCVCRDPNF